METRNTCAPGQESLDTHPRVGIVPIPVGACWPNLIADWWRPFRRHAHAARSFDDHTEVETAIG